MPGRKRRSKNKSAPSNDSSCSLPEWFHRCKQRRILNYDTNRFPFRELYADWLGIADSNDLERIHSVDSLKNSQTPVHHKIVYAWKNSNTLPKLSEAARLVNQVTQTKTYQSAEYLRLVNAYRLFIREIIEPICCDTNATDSDEKNQHIVYQCPPTTRVVFPNGKRTTAIHCDKEYKGHQPAEINGWVPLTRVWGNNSLWLESTPSKGDFEPVELQYGQCLIFDGHHCRHFTMHNDTPSCRVSFDFRVIPSSLCTQRNCLGDFCAEETTQDGYISYPHPFWSITKGKVLMRRPISIGCSATESKGDEKPEYTSVSTLLSELSLNSKELEGRHSRIC